MPTTVTDQAFGDNFDPGVPPTLPFVATVISISLLDADDDGLITANGTDAVNGSVVTAVYNGDTVTIDGVTITGATIYTEDGGRYFTPTDDTVLTPGTITNVGFVTTSTQLDLDSLLPACLTKGTFVTTFDGEVLVEDLKVGDLVKTMDHDYQPIRWIGRQTVPGTGEFAPVYFSKDSIGNTQSLRVSPQHRMFIDSWKCEVSFAAKEMLCAAKHLCDNRKIYTKPCDLVTYFHVMFDQHEIIFANGVATESFFAGDHVMRYDKKIHREIISLFPELSNMDMSRQQAARPFLKSYEASILTQTSHTPGYR